MRSGVSACSNLFINYASCIQSLSCLPFFLYHPYMHLLSPLNFIYYYVKGGKPPKMPVVIMAIGMRTKCHVPSLASLKSEDVKA